MSNATQSSDSSEQHSRNTELMTKKYSYPDTNDPNIQSKLYEKREFYYNRIPERKVSANSNYDEINEYRDDVCNRPFTLHEHQGMLGNLINPDTPYKGILIFHGLGTGKCVRGDTIVTVDGEQYPICELWQNVNEQIMYDNENGEWKQIKCNMYVPSFNGRIIPKRIVRVYREKIKSNMCEIVLTNGMSISITQIHMLLKYENDSMMWSNNLNIGNFVVTMHNNLIELNQIKNMKIVPFCGYVYDMEIEDTHNYIVANGIICHNTCVGVSIGEKFKPMVQKYGTKIHILVPGPILKEQWKSQLLFCTGETYKKYQDTQVIVDETEKNKIYKQALVQALQYYKIMSFRSFYKKVLGEKIAEEKTTTSSKRTYKKTDKGEFERDIAADRIYNLNNSLIIVDEAHNLTGNNYGKALKKIIAESFNLKIVLLSGTPMKNYGSDIIELINFLRPASSPMQRENLFNTPQDTHTMDLQKGGLEYFKHMINGYVSHVRGSDPLTFAKRIDKGKIPKGLQFTKVIQCKMLPFQRATYDGAIKMADDALDRKSEAVANFSFPGLSKDKQTIIGYYGRNGINVIKEQLKTSYEILNEKIGEMFFEGKEKTDLIDISNDGITITGKILKLPYLKYFSIKFYSALTKINKLVDGKKGAQTIFVYSNLVKVGIELFKEILLQNGYLEFQEDQKSYAIMNNTVCYFCGETKENHKAIDTHIFAPATFITITGKSSEEKIDVEQEDKKRILDTYFNRPDNKQGKFIKLVLGSRVMNEGVSMKNVGHVHVLDVYFNLGKVDQVVGRAIRWCSHYKPNATEPYNPEVFVYKYVVTLDKNEGLSSEEELYKKAESKYLLIKKLERSMKEQAIDCPLNVNGNIFPEEVKENEGCAAIVQTADPNNQSKAKCPAICDYQQCHYKCEDKILNEKYYDPQRKLYKKIRKTNLDYSTFTHKFAEFEINYAKNKIKEMFILHPVYKLEDIVNYIKDEYDVDKRDMFDELFVYRALHDMIPITENDFNNFKDTIVDKNNVPGYLIYRDQYYIFQPFDQNELVPLIYRTSNLYNTSYKISLFNYIKNIDKYQTNIQTKIETPIEDVHGYNFDDNMDYYDDRDEYDYVGIIDKEISRRKSKRADEITDVFKIREKLPKILDKKRGTGIPSLKGAVCNTSKSTEYLKNIAKQLGIPIKQMNSRTNICELIKTTLLLKEKYGTTANKDKMTYMRLPINHPVYPFPYNLEDRVKYLTDEIKQNIPNAVVNVKTLTKKSGPENGHPSYKIIVKSTDKYKDAIAKFLPTKTDDGWEILVD